MRIGRHVERMDQDHAVAFDRALERSRRGGFQGRLCIHPDQIGPVNAAYLPSKEELAQAERIVAAFKEAEARGAAAIQLDGQANAQTVAAEQLAGALRALVDVPVMMQDERLTSREAEALLARRERDWRKRKVLLDAMAAAGVSMDF